VLAPVSAETAAAFIFGSIAQGRESAGSDVDLMLIGISGFAQAVKLLHSAQTTLGREVNPKVFTASEFTSKAEKGAFLRNVMAKPKIFLIGSDHDLGATCWNQP